MSAATKISGAAPSARARQPLPRLPLITLALAIAGLGFALLSGPTGPWLPTALLLGTAGCTVVAELGRRTMLVVRAGAGGLIGLLLAGLVLVVTAALFVGLWIAPAAGWVVLLGTCGAALMLTSLPSLLSGEGTPWQRLAGPSWIANAAGLARLLIGVWLLLIAGVLVLGNIDMALEFVPFRVLFVGGVGAVLFAAAGFAVARGMRQGGAASWSSGPVTTTRDEQVVAAHLHDSVLQTLSLIQRNAADPARVAQLARQQERSLRAWLAGRDDTSGKTLAGALRLAAAEVEDEQPGAVIEVVAVGDGPLDREADAMVRAAREAMRNAVRHAGSPVRVFVEVEDGVRELFVRDSGPGFSLDDVGEERRGVRDAIIGRMEHVGGSATIDSGAAGTEIALRIPPAEGSAAR